MAWALRKNDIRLPKSFGYLLAGVCLIGVLLMPIGGFWLVSVHGIYIVVQADKEHQVDTQLIN